MASLSLQDWTEINDAIRKAKQAVDEASGVILQKVLAQNVAKHPPEVAMLMSLMKVLEETGPGNGLVYMTTPQREWTGGDSADPRNTMFREPHFVQGTGRRFSKEEVSKHLGIQVE